MAKVISFKPYYKWITFNTLKVEVPAGFEEVLNLIINGLPSILYHYCPFQIHIFCFKPYYKWITFNTLNTTILTNIGTYKVLNLIINGLPSIQCFKFSEALYKQEAVLNLIINGLPSIH